RYLRLGRLSRWRDPPSQRRGRRLGGRRNTARGDLARLHGPGRRELAGHPLPDSEPHRHADHRRRHVQLRLLAVPDDDWVRFHRDGHQPAVTPFPLNRLDDLVGETIERTVRARHVLRLRRHHSAAAIDPEAGGWANTGSFAPRTGCGVEVLVDGSDALRRIADAIRSARSHVHLAGWHFDPSFRLEEGGPTLRELLAETAQRVDVRVLAWAGAPLPLFHPDRGEVRQARDELVRGTRISMALDTHGRKFHCHHEKLVVVDDAVAFVGGIDLTGFGGDRLDSPE